MSFLRNLPRSQLKQSIRHVFDWQHFNKSTPIRTISLTSRLNENYYSILQVQQDASLSDIQEAYGTLTRKNDPMQHPDTAEAIRQLKRINEAYQVLNDTERRRKYDLGL